MEEYTDRIDINIKRQAQIKYWNGFKIAEIARQLDIPQSTISSWKEREKWDDISPIGRVEATLETRLCQLIIKDPKTGSDYKEIDLLSRQMERTARVKKYSHGNGNETDLNPKLKNRNANIENRKTAEKNPITAEQEELLINGFLGEMFGYQRTWHQAGQQHRIRNILKSRQIGATYYFAHEAFIDALVTGRNQIFLSASKKQALMFRSYITAYARKVADVELKGETILLPNGAELIFLGTNSATAQSYHGNLYFDEIFWVPKFEELRKVAAAMASQKQYRQTYFSTPSAVTHQAYDFWSGKAFNRHRADKVEIDISHANLVNGKLCADRQWRQIVTIYDAQQGGCTLFNIDDLKFENSPDEFNQLFMCEFADDTSGIFKFEDLQKCAVDSLEEWSDYKPFLYPKRPFGQREVWLGYDPAYTGDRAALAIVAPPSVEGAAFRVLEVQTFHGLDYEAQAEKIRQYCQMYNVTKINIDRTGMGDGVYQQVIKFFPLANGYAYNVDLKNEMVLKTLNLIQKRRLHFDGKEIINSFMTIKKQATRSGRQITYVSDRSAESSHGDIAWAIMMNILNEPYGGNESGHGVKIFTFEG